MNVFPLNRKARIAVAMAAVPVVLGAVFLTAYVVVQSSTFKGYLAKNLSGILGDHVDIGQDIQISSIFPRLSIVLPNVKIRPTSLGRNVERARIDSLTLAVSPGVLVSGGENGIVDIHVNQITLLSAAFSRPSPTSSLVSPLSTAQTTEENRQKAGPSHTPDSGKDSSPGNEDTIARSLGAFLQGSLSLEVEFTTDRIVYIARDVESGNIRYDITQLSLKSSDQSIQLAALVDVQDEPQRSVSAAFTTIDSSDRSDGNSLRGELSINTESVAIDSNDSQNSQITGFTHTFSTPVEINGNLIDFTTIEYRSPISWIRGTLGVDMSTERAHIQADLEVRQLQLSFAGNPKGASIEQSGGRSTPRLFPYKPFSFRIPEHIDAQVNMQLGAIRLDTTPIINGDLRLSITNGEAQLRTENLTLLGGQSELSVDITTPAHGFASVIMKLEADDIQLNRIRAPKSGEPIISKGKADLIMALRGSGPSPGHIAASSNGYVLASADGAEINQKYSTAIDRGVVSWGLERISVLTSKSESEQTRSRLSDSLLVPCASFKLYLNDGRAEVSNGIIIELPQNTLYSSGFINLYDEQMGFAFRARNKSLFEWSAISIARFAEISGTLSEPTVTLNKNELAKQGILSTSSIVWGPLPSLVYSLAESGLKNAQSKQCRKSID